MLILGLVTCVCVCVCVYVCVCVCVCVCECVTGLMHMPRNVILLTRLLMCVCSCIWVYVHVTCTGFMYVPRDVMLLYVPRSVMLTGVAHVCAYVCMGVCVCMCRLHVRATKRDALDRVAHVCHRSRPRPGCPWMCCRRPRVHGDHYDPKP
jgi:hypothetical protein